MKLALLLLIFASILNVPTVLAEEVNPVEVWALLISGDSQATCSNDTQYMYHVLTEHYQVDGIIYLDVNYDRPGVNDVANKVTVRYAIRITLAEWADENDIVFIYFSGHGAGYNVKYGKKEGGRYDTSTSGYIDEGDEIKENGHWVGIDEALCIETEKGARVYDYYWDDELATDLNYVKGRIVLVVQCCFSGGLIDDLSGPNRIIMTSTNESWYSYYSDTKEKMGDPGYGFSEWSEAFIDALHGERAYYDVTTHEVVHTDIAVDADYNDDGYVSLWEAWHYAWNHDEARYAVGHNTCPSGIPMDETPWFDDDGDGLPTFKNGEDCFDTNGQGDLAKQTYLGRKHTLSISTSTGGTTDPSPGTYTYHYGTYILVYAEPDDGYSFDYWILDGVKKYDNPIQVLVDSDHTLKAYFRWVGSGGGCPYVYTWNGLAYVLDNNVLGSCEVNGGADVEDFYRLEQAMAPHYVGDCFSVYSIMLGEFENEHSYLDQVRLLVIDHDSNVGVAVTSEGRILTYTDPNPPISAVDSYGYSWLHWLLEPDDNYYRGYPGDWLLIDFGSLDVSQAAKLILRTNLEWKEKTCIHVQILNETGGWIDTAILRTRYHWSTLIVDLSQYLPNPDGSLKIRLYFTGIHKIDYVGLDTSPQQNIQVYTTPPILTKHSENGKITYKLLLNDQIYAELLPGQQIQIYFTLPNQPNNKTRTFIIYIEGHYQTIK